MVGSLAGKQITNPVHDKIKMNIKKRQNSWKTLNETPPTARLNTTKNKNGSDHANYLFYQISTLRTGRWKKKKNAKEVKAIEEDGCLTYVNSWPEIISQNKIKNVYVSITTVRVWPLPAVPTFCGLVDITQVFFCVCNVLGYWDEFSKVLLLAFPNTKNNYWFNSVEYCMDVFLIKW